MKSKKAVVLDFAASTVLAFVITAAIVSYYMSGAYAFACAALIAPTLAFFCYRFSRRKDERIGGNERCDDYFDRLLFLSKRQLIAKIGKGFESVGLYCVKTSDCVICNGVAFVPLVKSDKRAVAAAITCSDGAKVLLAPRLDGEAKAFADKLDGMRLCLGFDCYKLYLSLNVEVPDVKLKTKRRGGWLKSALSPSKCAPYFMCALAIIALSVIGRTRVFTLVIGAVCLALSILCFVRGLIDRRRI